MTIQTESAAVRLRAARTTTRGTDAVVDARARVEASGRRLQVLLPDPSDPNAGPRWQRLRVSITEPGYVWAERRRVRWTEPEDECAYLKVVWIAAEELDRSAPDPIEWKLNYQGWVGTQQSLGEKLGVVRSYTNRRGAPIEEMSESSIRAELREIGKRYHEEWKTWRAFVSQPWVEYANVAPDRQRRGLGVALYQAAAGWLGEQGLTLRASTLQQPEARAVWEHIAEMWGLEKRHFSGLTRTHAGYSLDLRR